MFLLYPNVIETVAEWAFQPDRVVETNKLAACAN